MVRRGNVRGAAPPGYVRIIAGELRGRRLAVPEGTTVRPTPDRVRETLFNWLRADVEGASCLDLYAGTGALGFEALSRGAAHVWLVERDPVLTAALAEHAERLGVAPRIVRQDVPSLLRGRPPAGFDVVFLDPPYDTPIEPLLALLPPWLSPRAAVYVERARAEGLPEPAWGRWHRRGTAGAVEYGLLVTEPAETAVAPDST
jgi:16S rRNA (guanine966-N2)-methyltransferase